MTKFTDGELNVMKVLWEHGELKPKDIQERLPIELKNSALRSFLTVLLEKGHVKRRIIGKAYHYTATTRSRTTMRRSLKRIVDDFFDGSKQALLMDLIRSEKLNESELLELKRMAEGDSGTDSGVSRQNGGVSGKKRPRPQSKRKRS